MKRRIAAAALLVLSALALPTAAAAAEYDDAIALSWTGSSFASELVGPLYPSPVAVPGDTGDSSFLVRNDGPSAGQLTVEVVDVELARDPADPFYADFLLAGQPVIDLYERDTLIETRTIERGEVVRVSVPFEFPADVTTGNTRDGEVRVAFDVRLTLRGDTPPTPGGQIPVTGFEAEHLATIAGVVIAAGILTVGIVAIRRRKPPLDGRRPRR
ncbi:hypothetical protein [Agromyces atrinae]|uniref:LPXTG cell wall anchor domain-containing protein n=1 Tax=Agromyces atrinae TaxID=592376 RepID=A0A4Q2M7K8_9MICO|nr:hypothetical protein [Agromyces atrinae]NYD67860.1 hypothetical protein [Agromyces atrinae]RXZ87968.1 hypothetical protein ESP50_01875 [Agromyces atrinae]